MDRNWYETFFRGVALDLWRAAVPEERTSAEAEFLARALRLPPGARVLDVPCGLGRHSLALAARGFRPTGVDLSAEAISEAREKSAAAGLSVEWVQADMRDLPGDGSFDAAFCFGNSFGYLDPRGTRGFLGAVAQALRPRGRFALETGAVAECVLPRLREREWVRIGDILFLEENRYLPEESCVETAYTFVRGGTSETRKGLQWLFTLREIRELLEESGLRVESVAAGTDGGPFAPGAPVAVLLAARGSAAGGAA